MRRAKAWRSTAASGRRCLAASTSHQSRRRSCPPSGRAQSVSSPTTRNFGELEGKPLSEVGCGVAPLCHSSASQQLHLFTLQQTATDLAACLFAQMPPIPMPDLSRFSKVYKVRLCSISAPHLYVACLPAAATESRRLCSSFHVLHCEHRGLKTTRPLASQGHMNTGHAPGRTWPPTSPRS